MRENITGFIASSFDIYHPGYALMLKECKDNCNYLVVALHDNPKTANQDKNSPIMSLHERFLVLKSIRYIDKVILQETYSPLPNLKKVKPSILMESSSHAEEDIDKARDYMEFINGEVMIIPYYDAQSSTKIKGTGLAVCAVCIWPVIGSIIFSALP